MSWKHIIIIGILVVIGLFVFDSWDRGRIAKRVHEERYGRQTIDATVQGALSDARRIESMDHEELVRECVRIRCWEE